jgi:predicted TIM-barrel fold metal-dependent hydrolase
MSTTKEEAVITTRPDWLAQRLEAPLQPDMPIVDPHHHLWDRGGEPYFLPELLEDAQAGHHVVATVYLDCHTGYYSDGPEHLRSVGEVAYAASIARQCEAQPDSPRVCAGIVGSTDLRLGDRVREVLDAMAEAGQGRFRGIRQISVWHPDKAVKGTITNPPPGLLLDPDFRRGAGILAASGFSFDTWALHTQLVELYDLACVCPDLPIVMDHTGGAIGMGLYARRRDLAFDEWRAAIRTLAKAPNVHAKIGGFGMRLWGFGFHERPLPPSSEELAEAFRPYVETCIETFGPERCMFESNFPVDKGSFSYVNLWNAFKRLAKDYSPTEQNLLFHGTAERVYRLL